MTIWTNCSKKAGFLGFRLGTYEKLFGLQPKISLLLIRNFLTFEQKLEESVKLVEIVWAFKKYTWKKEQKRTIWILHCGCPKILLPFVKLFKNEEVLRIPSLVKCWYFTPVHNERSS